MIGRFDVAVILNHVGATKLIATESIQSLWSGYGEIKKIQVDKKKTFVVKLVAPPNEEEEDEEHLSLSHQRKLKSYLVEAAWYCNFFLLCDDLCRVPKCLAVERSGNQICLILEDLDACGFAARGLGGARRREESIRSCLRWLANFHARFMLVEPTDLWPIGTYWHLDTRPDELEELDDVELKEAAAAIDELLNAAQFKTLVHGDAKVANFCFSSNGKNVAAVDFQYVGGGVGVKDLAYFLGSAFTALGDTEMEKREAELLDYYFDHLRKALEMRDEIDGEKVEQEWRQLFPVAWTDFHRFIKGWSTRKYSKNSFSEKIAKKVILKISKLK